MSFKHKHVKGVRSREIWEGKWGHVTVAFIQTDLELDERHPEYDQVAFEELQEAAAAFFAANLHKYDRVIFEKAPREPVAAV